MARTRNEAESEDLRIRVPKALSGYRTLLARDGSILGANANDIARFLLTKEVERMFAADAHARRVPVAEAEGHDS